MRESQSPDENVASVERPGTASNQCVLWSRHHFYRAEKVGTQGSPENLAILASNIETLADEVFKPEQINPHLHIEYVPGHFYLGAGSEPLIVTLGEGDCCGSPEGT